MNDTGKLLVTLTAGFAAGVVAGILFAPEVGEKTREQLKSKASEIGDELEKQYQTELDKLKKKVADLSAELKETISESGIKEQVEDYANKAAESAHDLKERLSKS